MLMESTRKTFNQKLVQRGTLIFAKHKTWQEGQAGIVTEASPDLLRVQYPPEIQNVLNHFFISAAEVEDGEWEIRYSPDGLESVYAYPERREGQEDETE